MQNRPITKTPDLCVNSPYTGICSFFKTEIGYRIQPDNSGPHIALIGVPYDMGTSARSGARLGPRGVREASTLFSDGLKGVYDPERDETFLDGQFRLVDYGDVDIIQGDPGKSFANIEYAVSTIVQAGALPVIVGGDHSITIPAARALQYYKDLCLVHLDAHLDWSDSPGGQRYGHGSPVRRISEMDHFSQIIQIGIRGLGSSKEEDFREARNRGSQIYTMRDYRIKGLDYFESVIPEKRIFVTIDMDVLDPSIAPGTGSPQAGGMLYNEIDDLLEMISKKGKVIGFDLVEVSPPYDPAGITAQYAAQLIFNFIGYILKYSNS